MLGELKVGNFNLNAKACCVKEIKSKTVKGENYEIDVSIITAVDLKGSKALQMASGDFGIVIYNELNFGFMIGWKEFERFQADLEISEEKYEEFLDNFINDFSDTVIEFLNNK